MGKITLTGYVPESKAIEVYNKISKFTDYSKYIHIVKGITVEEISDNESISSWEVEFENGILCWKERDFFNDKELKIEFEKYEGDIEELKGFWSICQEKTGSVVTFEAEYSLGFSMLTEVLDPIAGEILADTISQILKGILVDIDLSSPRIRTFDTEEKTI